MVFYANRLRSHRQRNANLTPEHTAFLFQINEMNLELVALHLYTGALKCGELIG